MIPVPAISVTFTNTRAFSEPLMALPRAVELFVGKLSFIVVSAIKRTAPIGETHTPPKTRRRRKTGADRLKASIRRISFAKSGLRSSALVGTTKSYAGFVFFGTAPHPIQHRRMKALALWRPWLPDADAWGFVYRKRVNHPGSKGKDFLTPALRLLDDSGAAFGPDDQLDVATSVGIAWGDSFDAAMKEVVPVNAHGIGQALTVGKMGGPDFTVEPT